MEGTMTTIKLSSYVDDDVMASEENTVESIAKQLGLRLNEAERSKILESAKKFVDLFHNDLSEFKETIDDATYNDIDYLSEFNASKQVILSSSEIKSKVITATTALDSKMQMIAANEYRRNLFDIIIQKSKDEKQREILVGFIDYVKHKQDEFQIFSQEVTLNIENLRREKETVQQNARLLSKKAIMLSVTSIFFKRVLTKIDLDEDYQSKLIAIDRRLRTMYEILYMTQKNVIDIENQIDMYNELQNVIDEYKVSAMRIISMEIKNRVVLQDIKSMHSSLAQVRTTLNHLVADNAKVTDQLVKDIHALSKESILDKEVVSSSVESATQIRESSQHRALDTHRQIQQDNQKFLSKINQIVLNNERWNTRQNAKSMLDL
jgi:hypothetical protein